MRTKVRLQRRPNGDLTFRIVEANNEVVSRWLPSDPIQGPLDSGGFNTYADARSFSLGVDAVRSAAGLLPGTDVAAERAELDGDQRCARRPTVEEFVAA